VVMYGGFLYMVGSAVSDVKRGKKYIFDAILGLVIILSAYLILQTVNPRLTELRGVIIPEAADDFDDYDKTTEEQPGGGPAPGATTEVDKLLQAYASCYNYDWRLLKAVSSIESGLRLHPPFTCGGPKPCQCGIHKKDKSKFNCYVGLFQFEAGGCQENTKSYPNSLNLNCGTVEQPNDDPETSTAAGSFRINKSLLQIQQACGSQNLTVEDTVFLLYAGHNLGPGVMRFMLSAKACKKDQQLEQVKKYVDTHADYKATLAEGGKYDPIARAERKWNYSQKAVDLLAGYGVTSLYPAGAKNDQTCPKVTGERAFKELKPNS
ncbi:MAG: hypothetical protein Q7N87_01305, partial [Candidatus Uhrbacteria bacterium]|nr:hypothetical protein [Candidatus Uhrbacteria bacterium]